MNYRSIAARIPDIVRQKRLMIPIDPIGKAEPVSSNQHMKLLFAIWTEFVYPDTDEDMGCPKCLQRILLNFRQMKDELINLEKEHLLLKSIK